MRTLYVTEFDSTDIDLYSGSGYFIPRALESSGLTVERLRVRNPVRHILTAGVKKGYYSGVRGTTYIGKRAPARLRSYARQVSTALLDTCPDVIFAPHAFPLAHLPAEFPTAFWTDATFPGLMGFYPEFSNLCRETVRDSMTAEAIALERCTLAVYSSDWAAETALDNYDVHPSKVRVVPFGANMDSRRSFKEVRAVVRNRSKDVCRLLFLGGDWVRKGGNTAVAVTTSLNRIGTRSQLTVVGPHPAVVGPVPDYVNVLGYVSKKSMAGIQLIESLLSEAHFLLLPTTIDCCPVSLAESNAFGVPCLTSRLAGIPTVITDEVNGRMFSTSSPPDEYAAYASSVFHDTGRYERLAMSSYEEYSARLNWNAAGRAVSHLLEDIGRKGGENPPQ